MPKIPENSSDSSDSSDESLLKFTISLLSLLYFYPWHFCKIPGDFECHTPIEIFFN